MVNLMKGLKGVLFTKALLAAMILTTVAARSATIETISHSLAGDGKERVTFTLNEPLSPKIFTIKGDNPRLVVDFPGTTYKGKGTVTPPEGKLATNIRVGVHQDPEQKVRVAIDLTKDTVVEHASLPGETANVLILELAGKISVEGKAEPAKKVDKVVVAPVAATPGKAVSAAPVEIKPMPSPKPQEEKQEVAAVSSAVPAAPPAGKPRVLNISFDDSSAKGEMVLFHLSGFHPPSVSAVEKDNPRVFCDFLGMEIDKGVEEVITAKGKFVERITAAKPSTPEKVRVVLHLVPNRDYDLQQMFFKNDNLFVLIVNELPPAKSP
jgi:AMIN domain